MNSKEKCKELKSIRKKIADKMGIDLHQRECTFDGECKGTCPKCKQEEDVLNKAIGQKVGALALGVAMSMSMAACDVPFDKSDIGGMSVPIGEWIVPEKETNVLSGDVVYVGNDMEEDNLDNCEEDNCETDFDLLGNMSNAE